MHEKKLVMSLLLTTQTYTAAKGDFCHQHAMTLAGNQGTSLTSTAIKVPFQ